MNVALDAAWRTANPPFHDKTVFVVGYVSVKLLSQALESISKHIELALPNSDLRLAHDWHAHDGFQKEGEPISFTDFLNLVASEDLLRKRSPGDTKVYLALFPVSLDFLLRFRVVPVDEVSDMNEEVAEFDFTGYGVDVDEVTKRLKDFPELAYSVVPSFEYFRGAYAG
jgi:hypothetical protein